jgi:Zn-dependent protease with chaperone function
MCTRPRLSLHPGESWNVPAGLPVDPAARITALHAALVVRTGISADLALALDDSRVNASAVTRRGSGTIHLHGGLVAALAETPDPDLAVSLVLAHEMGHLARRDTDRMSTAVFAAFVGSLAGLGLIGAAAAAGSWPLVLVGFFLGPIATIAATLRAAFFGRRAEAAADCYAVETLGHPAAFIETLHWIEKYETRLVRLQRAALRPEPGDPSQPASSARGSGLPTGFRLFGPPLSAAALAAADALLAEEPPAAPPSRISRVGMALSALFEAHPPAAARIAHLRRLERAAAK